MDPETYSFNSHYNPPIGLLETGAASMPQLVLTTDDFTEAQKNFTPSSLKGINLQKSDVAWNDIGGTPSAVVVWPQPLKKSFSHHISSPGLVEVRQTLKETLEWPTKYAHLYKDVPIRMRSGYALPYPHLSSDQAPASTNNKRTHNFWRAGRGISWAAAHR